MRFSTLALILLLVGWRDTSLAGNYTLAVTNGTNSCPIPGWQPGNMSTGIDFTVMQSGSNVTAVIGGLTGVFLSAALGSASLTGKTSGDDLEATLHGTRSY